MSAELDAEVLRCDLSRLIIGIIQLHGPDLTRFPWFQAPDSNRLSAAEDLLTDLGVLGPDGNLNGLGKLVADLPLHSTWALGGGRCQRASPRARHSCGGTIG